MDGRVELGFRADPGGTRLSGLYHRAPLRALFPSPTEPEMATAVLVTTSGGLVGGDRLAVEVTAEAGASAQVTAQAAEKVYRSTGATCCIDVALRAEAGSWLEWLPQETILFDGARLARCTRIDGARDARVLAGELLVFGRHARGELVRHGSLSERWEIWQAGRLVWADALMLGDDLARALTAPACLAGAAAVATTVYLGQESMSALALARDLTQAETACDMLTVATCVGGVVVVRWLGRDARALRDAFGRFWAAFRHRIGGFAERLPRVWAI